MIAVLSLLKRLFCTNMVDYYYYILVFYCERMKSQGHLFGTQDGILVCMGKSRDKKQCRSLGCRKHLKSGRGTCIQGHPLGQKRGMCNLKWGT